MFLFKACLKAATDGASLTSFGRMFYARIVREGKSQGTDVCKLCSSEYVQNFEDYT